MDDGHDKHDIHEHDNGGCHYYVRTDDNYVLHDDGTNYYDKHNDKHHYDNLNDDHCTAYDDEHDGTAVHDNHGRPYTISRSCPVHDTHHVLRSTTSTASPTSAGDNDIDKHDHHLYDKHDKHHKHHYKHYVHNDDDYLHDTAPDHDYSDTDEHDDPADYEHLLTGYADSFQHDRKFASFPVITSPEAKRLLDLAVRSGLGGSHNPDHHVSAGGDSHNHDDSSTSTT